jgi:hypothetical protein
LGATDYRPQQANIQELGACAFTPHRLGLNDNDPAANNTKTKLMAYSVEELLKETDSASLAHGETDALVLRA